MLIVSTNEKFTIVSSSPNVTTITDDKGPLIRDSNWRGARICYNGNATMYHFKCAVPVINWPGILSEVEPAPSRRLSWYRYTGNSTRRRACMVQVRVEVRMLYCRRVEIENIACRKYDINYQRRPALIILT